MHNNVIPHVLSLLGLLNLFFIWRGHRAILAGNWLIHRNMMVVSLVLFASTLGGFGYFLWSTRLWALIGTQTLFIIYVALVIVAGLMILVTLWRVVKHLLLPHKLLARKTIIVWQLACLAGVLLHTLIGFSFAM